MPNIPDPDLLPGEKENNKVIKIVGEQPKFDFPLKTTLTSAPIWA